jgi:hypothetical protein
VGDPKALSAKLGEELFAPLFADFAEHGPDAIERVRQEDPAAYVRVIASFVP